MFLRRSLRCSFCRRNEREVSKLVAGAKAYICDECVALAGRIMQGQSDEQQRPQPAQSPWRRLGNFIRNLLHPGMMRRQDELATG